MPTKLNMYIFLKAGFLDIKGRIPPPKCTNIWKSAKWEGPIFKPKKLCCRFLSLENIQNLSISVSMVQFEIKGNQR